MNDIFSNLKVSMESTHLDGDLKTINLKVLYKGQPARNYDYTYFDGRDWSNIFSAKDGHRHRGTARACQRPQSATPHRVYV